MLIFTGTAPTSGLGIPQPSDGRRRPGVGVGGDLGGDVYGAHFFVRRHTVRGESSCTSAVPVLDPPVVEPLASSYA